MYFTENPFATNIITIGSIVLGGTQFNYPPSGTIDCSQFQGFSFSIDALSDPGWIVDFTWFADPQANTPIADRRMVLGGISINQSFVRGTLPHLTDYLSILFTTLDGLQGGLDLALAHRQNGIQQFVPLDPTVIGPVISQAVNNGATFTVNGNKGIYAGPAVLHYNGPGGGVGSAVTLEYLSNGNVWVEFVRMAWVAAPNPFFPVQVMLPPNPVRAKLINASGAVGNFSVALVADIMRCGG